MELVAFVLGAVLVLVAGLWVMWSGRLDSDADDTEELVAEQEGILTREDLGNPRQVLGSPPKRRNLVMILSELVTLVMTAVLAIVVLTLPESDLPLEFKGVIGAGFFVAGFLVARAMVIRLGLTRMFG